MAVPSQSPVAAGSGSSSGAGAGAGVVGTGPNVSSHSVSTDPASLLDSLDAYTSSRATVAAVSAAAAAASASATGPSLSKSLSAQTSSSLDPVDFLNRHYTNEHMLHSQLPALRMAVQDRMESLEDRISTALQRQSETSETTRKHVQEAKLSIASLETRIRLVQEKASQSERAVLEITKDMKRLDCAKRHLQKTITTLKQLHMLVHAVEQLRLACLLKPFGDYRAASQLVDATRLLLQHFQAYTVKVQPMRLLSLKVKAIQKELLKGLLRGFRIVGFGLILAMEMEDGTVKAAKPTRTDDPDSQDYDNYDQQEEKTLDAPADDEETMPVMTPQVMADGTLLIDSLGPDVRADFIQTLSHDHLAPYDELFIPKPPKNIKQHSFKVQREEDQEKPPYSLEQVDRRFAWYRRTLRDVCDKFPNVFPTYWNFQYSMTVYFLEMVRSISILPFLPSTPLTPLIPFTHSHPHPFVHQSKEHLLKLLDGPTKDKDSENATTLLKALQKTILFEKEMMAWLQRDFGTIFLVNDGKAPTATSQTAIRGDQGEVLEFDESGRAVAASSAQGIRIKYERQKREQRKGESEKIAAAALDEGRASVEQAPVDPLVGVASSAFDNFMAPYIALEEQSMDEQLVESLGDGAVDTRGELPVFTSSTGLFVYIKGSITRCTAMTKGKAFFLLFQAFQDSLNKYAQILGGKLPQPAATSQNTVVGGINIGSSFGKQQGPPSSKGASIAIPKGGEVTVCHVISTCEYCADTVEALEDLIRDTIEQKFKDRIDMSIQQEHFHDVTAKCITVLVSGLMNRLQDALKTMIDINWATFDMVGEESSYVRMIQTEWVPFFATVRGLVPSSYFRSFCDKFAMAFSSTYFFNSYSTQAHW
jgi:hypothetical protein